jgi:hypothetical protein
MPLSIIKRLRAKRRASELASAVALDADKLLEQWGVAAYEAASDLSWKESVGFVSSPSPGHWWEVRREIGRRIGEVENDPVARFAL